MADWRGRGVPSKMRRGVPVIHGQDAHATEAAILRCFALQEA